MDVQQLDAAVRISGATLLLLLALLLFRDAGSRRLAVAFAPLALGLCGFLAGNTPDPALKLSGVADAVAHLLSGYAAVFLWWFCLAYFDRDFRPRGAVLATGALWFAIASADRGLLGPRFADKGLSWALVALGFAMVLHLAWRLLRDREGDLVENRRRARVLVVVLLAAQLFVELAKEAVFGLDWRPRGFTIVQNAAIFAYALWLLMLFVQTRPSHLTSAREGAPNLGDGASTLGADESLLARLGVLVEVERVYLDSHLTFSAFTKRMGAPERVVRRLINHRLGHDHFRSFLNVHRVAEARRRLADPAQAGEKLIAIALDSGFASLASFNRVFRSLEGCTPSDFRRAHLAVPAVTAFEKRSAAF